MNQLLRVSRRVLMLIMCFCCANIIAQNSEIDSLKNVISAAKEDTNKVKALIDLSIAYYGEDPIEAITQGVKARELALKLNYQKGTALALKSIGIAHYLQSNYIEAIDQWQKAITVFDTIGDKNGVANMLSNIGGIYFNQGDDATSLDYYLQALKIAEELNDTLRIATVCINIGALYNNKKATYNLAEQYYLRALPLSEALNDLDAIGTVTVNLGELYMLLDKDSLARVYFMRAIDVLRGSENLPYALNDLGKLYNKQGDFNKAIQYHTEAYDFASKLDAKLDMLQSLIGLASAKNAQGIFKPAIADYLQAEKLATDIGANNELRDIYKGLSETYSHTGDYKNAFTYSTLYASIKDTIYNIDTDKKLQGLSFNFEIEKKESQIDLLTKDKELQEVVIQRQTLAKNASLAGLGLILIIAFILYRSYINKVRTNKILDEQKDQIEGLLLNILPAEVAKELQVEGHATPRYYESVSVLFTDFKGFTLMSQDMTPNELVDELNSFFVAFDNIIQKYNLEKIKTIGDSYMCAGGIPVANNTHAYDIIMAGLEIRDYIHEKNKTKTEKGMPAWDLRIGIHSGPVVAGVVGLKKYAYDIWGSTVNVASRMESSGEPGKVNISSYTYSIIKDSFHCTHRGKISAKSIGEIDMYFVEPAKHEILEVV